MPLIIVPTSQIYRVALASAFGQPENVFEEVNTLLGFGRENLQMAQMCDIRIRFLLHEDTFLNYLFRWVTRSQPAAPRAVVHPVEARPVPQGCLRHSSVPYPYAKPSHNPYCRGAWRLDRPRRQLPEWSRGSTSSRGAPSAQTLLRWDASRRLPK